jgi:hypothetical protein
LAAILAYLAGTMAPFGRLAAALSLAFGRLAAALPLAFGRLPAALPLAFGRLPGSAGPTGPAFSLRGVQLVDVVSQSLAMQAVMDRVADFLTKPFLHGLAGSSRPAANDPAALLRLLSITLDLASNLTLGLRLARFNP